MGSPFFRSLGLILQLAVVLVLGVELRGDEPTKDRVRREAREAWRTIRQKYTGKMFHQTEVRIDQVLEPKVIEVSRVNRKNAVHNVTPNTFRVDGTLAHERIDSSRVRSLANFSIEDVEKLPKSHKTTEAANILNAEYQSSINLNEKAAIDALGFSDSKAYEESSSWFNRLLFPCLVFDGISTIDAELLAAIENPYINEELLYRFVDADELPGGLVQIKFKFSSGTGTLVIDLDPLRSWAIVRSRIKVEEIGGATYNADLVYEYPVELPEGFHPTSGVFVWTNKDGDKRFGAEERSEYTQLEPTPYSAEDCFLSAFGLPEPSRDKKSFETRLVVFAIACAVAIFWLVTSLRKSKAAKLHSYHE